MRKTPLNKEETQKLIRISQNYALHNHGVQFYDYQLKIIERVFSRLFGRTGGELFIKMSRQCGKTETLVNMVEFAMVFWPKLYGRPLRVGIFAPQNEQAKTDFDRLKQYLQESQRSGFQSVIDPNESNAVTLQLANRSYCYIFPLRETSNPESKTLDWIIYEEANKIDDMQKANKSDPMGSSTNALRLSIGVGGYSANYFYRADRDGKEMIEAPVDEVISDRRKMYERTGNGDHLAYEQFFNEYIAEHGADSDAVKTQYYLKFIIGVGQFITREMLDKLYNKIPIVTKTDKDVSVVVGIDTAKHPDRTIVTVKNIEPIVERYVDENDDVKERVIRPQSILCWLRLQGDNYLDQFHIIKKFLSNFKRVEAIAIDSTGQGDFMPDMFERETDYYIIRVKFSMQSKDVIYKNLMSQIHNTATALPDVDTVERHEFDAEMLDLQKEYKGEYLSVHHPKLPDAHDDYADSWALAEFAHHTLVAGSPDIAVISTSHATIGRQKQDFDDYLYDEDDE